MSETLDPVVETPAVETTPDLRSALESAFAADANAPETPAPTDGAARDDKGRFAPKAETISADQTIKTPDQPAAPAPEAQPEPIQPPASWSAQAKAKFNALDPEVQAEVIKREKDIARGFEERATQLKKYEPLEQVIAPERERLAMSGQDEASYVRALITADKMLQGANRHQAFAQLAQMYGVDLRQFAQPGGQQQQPLAQLPPEFQGLMQEVSTLKQTVTQQQAAAQQASQAQYQAQIEAFTADPAHLYYENVRPRMAELLRSGAAQDLKSAYEQACWADPSIRPLMLKTQADQAEAEARAAASAKVATARGAAVSITGSPAPGSAPTRGGPAPSARELLEQGFAGTL